jgi:hypothetical protein
MKAKISNKIYTDRNGNNLFHIRHCNSDIEYIRQDAFIKKAETYLKEKFAKDVSVLAGGAVHINFETAINNFINYMKGE